MDWSTLGLPIHGQLQEFTQTHVHWVSDTIQLSHPLSSTSPPSFNLSQHQGLLKGVSSLYQVAKVLELQIQHQSFQWIFRTDFLQDGLVGSPHSPRDSQESSPAPQFKSISSSAFSLLYGPTLNGNSLQYFCLENPMDRRAWRATVHRAAKSQTQLKQLSMHACSHPYMTTGKTIALRIQTFVRKVMSFLF